MDYGYQMLLDEMMAAKHAKDASRLDLAKRAMAHYAARGTAIDTTNNQYAAVVELDPKFYG